MGAKDLVGMLLKRNVEQSEIFTSPDAALWRKKYRVDHPTEIAAFKCMDGRLTLPVITETPPGIIQPFRNLGGEFDLGWPFLGSLVMDWVEYSVSRSRLVMPLITYHWSKGDTHRGCKGFNYDTKAAIQFTHSLRGQFERLLGENHRIVYPIQVGIETDEDALVFHGHEGATVDLASLQTDIADEQLQGLLATLFPDMNRQFINDLLPLLRGNLNHIWDIRNQNRPVSEIGHQEQVLAFGRGFDWLHWPNKALIVGPYAPDISRPVAVAAGLLLSNIREGRVPERDGVVLIVSAVYRQEAGPEKKFAEEKSRSLTRIAQEVIHEKVPELERYMSVLVGVTNLNTREFSRIDQN